MPSKSRGSARDLAIARSKDHRAIGVGVHIEGALQRHTCQAIRAAPQQRRDMRQFRTIGAVRGKGFSAQCAHSAEPTTPGAHADHATTAKSTCSTLGGASATAGRTNSSVGVGKGFL